MTGPRFSASLLEQPSQRAARDARPAPARLAVSLPWPRPRRRFRLSTFFFGWTEIHAWRRSEPVLGAPEPALLGGKGWGAPGLGGQCVSGGSPAPPPWLLLWSPGLRSWLGQELRCFILAFSLLSNECVYVPQRFVRKIFEHTPPLGEVSVAPASWPRACRLLGGDTCSPLSVSTPVPRATATVVGRMGRCLKGCSCYSYSHFSALRPAGVVELQMSV